MEFKFKIGDTVITDKEQIGKIIGRSVYEDHDGCDENGPIIILWNYYDIEFEDGTIDTVAQRKLRLKR